MIGPSIIANMPPLCKTQQHYTPLPQLLETKQEAAASNDIFILQIIEKVEMMKSITFIAILLQFITHVNAEIFKKNNNRKSTNRNLRRDDLIRIAGSDRFDELLVATASSSAATEDTDDRFSELLGGATSSSAATTPKPTSGRFSIPTIYNPPSPSSVASQAIPQPPLSPPTSSSPTTKTNYWYPQRTTCITTNTFTCYTCILGTNYPSWMDDDSIATGYLFDTEEECCEEFDCDKSDAPTLGPTTEHPTFNRFTQWSPTNHPSVNEAKQPTTLEPTRYPSTSPSTVDPSSSPSLKPTTLMPSDASSQKPITMTPSATPSHKPTTVKPSLSPSQSPTTSQPSNSPSQKPTQHPSLSPSTSQPSDSPTIQEDVIPLYNELDTATYTEGTLVEVDGIVYECNGFPFTLYCKLPDYKPNSVDTNWQDVWIVSPTLKPSTASPTSRPSQAPVTLMPSVQPSQAPVTFAPSEAPTTLVQSLSPSTAPVTSKPTPQPVTQSPTTYPSRMPVTQSPITSTPSQKPSVSPSLRPSSNAPTLYEITPFPTPTASNNNVDTNDEEREVLYCPPQYNETISSTYDEGSQVSVNGIAYECNPFPFNVYCSMPKYRPQSIEEDTPWENIWKEFGTCLVSDSPSMSPTVRPSVSPTDMPTKRPTNIPTSSPSTSPSRSPSSMPSRSPSQSPSSKPTVTPSNEPTSSSPTLSPSFYPTLSPSLYPSRGPTLSPSNEPSKAPTDEPSSKPTVAPSLSPVIETTSPTINSKDSDSSQPLCSCAPRSFTVQVDPTKVSCDDNNTIKSNGGISKTECVWKNAIDDSMDADITPLNIKTRFVGFVELGNNRQVISRSVREADAESNGDTFTFESISASLSPTESIDDQLNHIPYAAGLLFVGENTKGEELNASFMWYYSHSCEEENGVTIVEDDVFGMNIWTSVEEPDSVFCPATAADESFIPSYDESAASTYTEGTLVELDGVIYKCNDFPFHLYCKLNEYKPNSAENWQDVWTAIDAADTIMEPAVTASPSSRPSQAPTTSMPSMRPSLKPEADTTSKPTSQEMLPVDQPTGMSSSCPPAYDEVAAPLYKAGSTVEVGGYIYICNGDPYGLYCSWSVFKPTVDGNKWQDTWTKLGPCKGDTQSVPVRPSSESQPAPTPKPQSEKEPPTLVNTSDGDDTHSPTKSPSAKSAKMMMAKSSKASGACGSKSSKKSSSEETVTASLTIELSDMSSELNDTGTAIFEETCASFISDQLESDEICASGVECSITKQEFVEADTLSIGIDVGATGDNITGIDFQDFVKEALRSNEFVEELEDTGLNDFDELDSITVAAELQAIDNNLDVSDSKPSNKKAVLWTMFVLAAVGVIVGTLLVQRRSNRKLSLPRPRRSRRRLEKRQQTQYTGGDSSEEDFSEDKYAASYDNEQVPMGGPPTPMSIATEAGQPPPISEIRHYQKHHPQTLPPPSIINTSRSRSKQQDDWIAASTPSSMDCLPESNSRILHDLHKGDGGRPTRFTKRTLVAPKGKLGIVIKKGPMGCMIHSVKQGSPMEGVLHGEDIIIAFNDENVANYTARQLTMLIARNVDVTKKFTVLSQKQNSAPIPARGSAMRR